VRWVAATTLRMLCTALLLAASSVPTPTAAQEATSPPTANAVLARIAAQGSTTNTIAVFVPGDPVPRRKQDVAAGTMVVFSPDSQWVITYGRVEGNPAPLLTYARVGQEPARIQLEAGFSPLFVHVSAESRYFSYTVVSYTAGRWFAATVELSSGQAIGFSGTYNFGAATPEVSSGFPGIPEIVAWHNNGKRLIVSALQFGTNSGQRFNGLYALDLGALPVGYDGPLPAAQAILTGEKEKIIGMPMIAPDGMRAAYFTADPANPPESYAAKEGIEPNTLTVIPLTGSGEKTRAQSSKGQAIALAAWLPESRQLLYVEGGFKNTIYTVAARVTVLDATTGRLTPGSVIEPDPKQYVFSVLVCDQTLYFVSKVYKTDFSGVSTLYSAPLREVSVRSKPLAAGQNIGLLGCTVAR